MGKKVFQFVACRTLDTYAHVTSDMQKQAAVVTEDFMSNILGKGLKPWARKDEQAEQAV